MNVSLKNRKLFIISPRDGIAFVSITVSFMQVNLLVFRQRDRNQGEGFWTSETYEVGLLTNGLPVCWAIPQKATRTEMVCIHKKSFKLWQEKMNWILSHKPWRSTWRLKETSTWCVFVPLSQCWLCETVWTSPWGGGLGKIVECCLLRRTEREVTGPSLLS